MSLNIHQKINSRYYWVVASIESWNEWMHEFPEEQDVSHANDYKQLANMIKAQNKKIRR